MVLIEQKAVIAPKSGFDNPFLPYFPAIAIASLCKQIAENTDGLNRVVSP
jgi:hypothetical protein